MKPKTFSALAYSLMALGASFAVAGEDEVQKADPFDTGKWTWSGGPGTVQLHGEGWRLVGGESGEFLQSVDWDSTSANWLFLRGEWLGHSQEADGLIIRWNGCEVILFPTEDGWVPSVGSMLFRQEFAVPFDSTYEIGLYQDSSGRIDFSWNGVLLLEKAGFGYPGEDLLLVTVPPGWELGLEELSWKAPQEVPMTIIDEEAKSQVGQVLRPGESNNPKGVDVPPPTGPPPPHPYLAMDENGHLLSTPGKSVTEGTGKLHVSRSLIGNGKADRAESNKE